jgi:hypothetical protein
VFRFVAVSVFATGGSVSILQILLSPKSRLVIAIFPWFTSRGLRLLTRRIRVATARTKRGELLLLLLMRILRFFSSFLVFPERILLVRGTGYGTILDESERDQTVSAIDITE